jgi:hypothetical protein
LVEATGSISALAQKHVPEDATDKLLIGCPAALTGAQSVRGARLRTTAFTCNDGTWVETVSSVSPGHDYTYEADNSYVQADGTSVLANPHQEYTYSTSDDYHAAP